MLLVFPKVEVYGRENVALGDIAVERRNEEPGSEVIPWDM